MTVNFPGRNIYSQNTPQQKQNDTKNSAAGVGHTFSGNSS